VEYPGALYHLTARGNDQQTIYHDETDRQHFLKLFGHEIPQQRRRCYAYCLMGNEAPRSSLLRLRSHFGYEGRKLRGILRNSPKPLPSFAKATEGSAFLFG
jgi:hypothetical protein